jgi:hypothetical protein
MARRGKKYGHHSVGQEGTCEMCGREKPLTEHHLIPRAVHRKRYFAKRFSKEEMVSRTIMICRMCHRGIHRIIPDEKELARDYNTLESLMADERIARHVVWVAKQR